jgi:DNA segregation ATPase FtsK/SpoIIIE, S-DNA-T family
MLKELSLWEDIDTAEIKDMLESCDGLFGIQLKISREDVGFKVVKQSGGEYRLFDPYEPLSEELFHFEGNHTRSVIKPLRIHLCEDLIRKIQNEVINVEDILILTLIFRRSKQFNEKALALYESYLEGVDEPGSSKLIRSIQSKALKKLSLLSSFDTSNPRNEMIEDKIISKSYETQFILSTNNYTLAGHVEKMLSGMNELSFTQAYNLDKYQPKLFLSNKEIEMFIPNQTVDKVQKNVEPVNNDFYLPRSQNEEVGSKDWQKEVKQSLARLGIISSAKSVKTTQKDGLRLSFVELKLPDKVAYTKVKRKEEDIQTDLGVDSLDISQGSSPGYIKFSLPKDTPTLTYLGDIMDDHLQNDGLLSFPAGIDEDGNIVDIHLEKVRHLMVAGTTGSGKSAFLNCVITTLLSKYPPSHMEMILIDPKRVELQSFADFPHVKNLITNVKIANGALSKLVQEMEKRYELFEKQGVKSLLEYNKKHTKLPYIVCAIDEYADLVMQNKEVEDYVVMLGQKARAAGIHLIICTQRPSANIVSSSIKANFPNMISFNLSSSSNYRTVFGTSIPYKLLGNGDGVAKLESSHKEFVRFQSPIISVEGEEEERCIKSLLSKYAGYEKAEELEQEDTETPYDLVKKFILETKTTKIKEIQLGLGIRMNTIQEVMKQLVDEGMLTKHKARSKGYELNEEYLDS